MIITQQVRHFTYRFVRAAHIHIHTHTQSAAHLPGAFRIRSVSIELRPVRVCTPDADPAPSGVEPVTTDPRAGAGPTTRPSPSFSGRRLALRPCAADRCMFQTLERRTAALPSLRRPLYTPPICCRSIDLE